MAKRKPAAALFEVIHTAPPPPLILSRQKRPWWSGLLPAGSQAEALRSMHPSMIPDQPHPSAPAPASVSCSPEAELRARFSQSDSAHATAVFSADESDEVETEEPAAAPTSEPLTVSEFCDGGVRIDRSRQELTFRLDYTTAALVAFIGLVFLGLAFVVGKHLAERNNDDPAISALRAGQPDPEVMNVDHNETNVSQARSSVGSAQGAASASPTPVSDAAVTGAVAAVGSRTIGLDYLVVQSYPDKESAQELADMLTGHGVACTVEHGLRWAPKWFSVVTAEGYPPHSPQGDRLADSIRKVAADVSRQGRHYRFEPQGYQWNQ